MRLFPRGRPQTVGKTSIKPHRTTLTLPRALGSQIPPLENTTRFSPNLDFNDYNPNDSTLEVPYTCHRYESRKIAGADLAIDHVHYDGEYWDWGVKWAPFAAEIAAEVVPVYAGFLGSGAAGLDTHVNVLDIGLDDDEAPSTRLHLRDSCYGFSGNTCYIDMTGSKLFGGAEFRYALAHNLYHCVQHRLGLTPSDTQLQSAEWWYEGAAEYFAASFCTDDTSPAWGQSKWFNVNQPIYRQGDYAGLFLHHLSNVGWTDADIHAWIASHTLTDSAQHELARMAQDTVLVENFPSFAAHYFDKQITFKYGTAVPLRYRPGAPEGFLGRLDDKTNPDFSFGAKPFTIMERYTGILPTDRNVTFNLTFGHPEVANRTVIQWKKTGDPTWRTMALGQPVDVAPNMYPLADGTNITCPQRDTKYYFTVTETYDGGYESGGPDQIINVVKVDYRFPDDAPPSAIDPACEPEAPEVPAPAPVHASMHPKCNRYIMGREVRLYNCRDSLAKAGVAFQDFFAWNPVLEGECVPVVDFAYCIGVST